MRSEAGDERPETEALLLRAAAGDADAAAALLEGFRPRLRKMVEARLDRRLRTRVDVSDVLQDVNLEATQRLPGYLDERPMPVFLWLRFLTAQRLARLRRAHFGADRRDLRREVEGICFYAASSVDCLATQLAADQTSPTHAVRREEQRVLLERGLEQLNEADREVLSLRHYEQLSNLEVARELGIEPSAASKRYLRALERLREVMGGRPDSSTTGP
jgi:RNA polymerase sigma-70 factor (ECF subfamily)